MAFPLAGKLLEHGPEKLKLLQSPMLGKEKAGAFVPEMISCRFDNFVRPPCKEECSRDDRQDTPWPGMLDYTYLLSSV